MQIGHFLCRDLDHLAVVRHQAVDFAFDVSRLRVDACCNAFAAQLVQHVERRDVALFVFRFIFWQTAVAPVAALGIPKMSLYWISVATELAYHLDVIIKTPALTVLKRKLGMRIAVCIYD